MGFLKNIFKSSDTNIPVERNSINNKESFVGSVDDKESFMKTLGSYKYFLFTSKDNDDKITMSIQQKTNDIGELSDGYHTFNELYYYRLLYNAAFFNSLATKSGEETCDVHKSKRHNDGEECFGGGWFIVMAELPTGQISNHYELKYWDLFKIPERECANRWDGHTPQDAAERLEEYLNR